MGGGHGLCDRGRDHQRRTWEPKTVRPGQEQTPAQRGDDFWETAKGEVGRWDEDTRSADVDADCVP